MSDPGLLNHILVTIEALIGLLFVALSTGLIFAKVSRPHATVMFSKQILIHKRNNKRILMFRVANARGSDILDAHISVSVLKDEISKEGDHIRRFHRLKLVSDRSPLFKMSWNVMHEIDENSPLHGVDWTQPSKVITSFIITINAHDQNYARSIYDRHIYYPQDIVLDAHFDDVIHRLNDGRWLLDLNRFNRLKPK